MHWNLRHTYKVLDLDNEGVDQWVKSRRGTSPAGKVGVKSWELEGELIEEQLTHTKYTEWV